MVVVERGSVFRAWMVHGRGSLPGAGSEPEVRVRGHGGARSTPVNQSSWRFKFGGRIRLLVRFKLSFRRLFAGIWKTGGERKIEVRLPSVRLLPGYAMPSWPFSKKTHGSWIQGSGILPGSWTFSQNFGLVSAELNRKCNADINATIYNRNK